MKKMLMIALFSCLLNSCGMNISNGSDFSENSNYKNKSQILRSTKENSLIEENNQTEALLDTLKFLDEIPRGIPLDSILNYEEWNSQPKENANPLDKIYTILLITRHVRDLDNLKQQAHTNSSNNVVNIETVGPDNALFLKIIGSLLKIDAIAGGSTDRHAATARLVASSSNGEYKLLHEFDEQNLGYLKGKSEKEILCDHKFIKMFNNPNYRIDENAETGAEISERVDDATDMLLLSVIKNRYKALKKTKGNNFKIEPLEEIIKNTKGRKGIEAIKNFLFNELEKPTNSYFQIMNLLKHTMLYIVTSRCTINWKLKDYTEDMHLPLQLKTLQNCNMFCVKYYFFRKENKYQILKTNAEHGNQPYCISPLDFILFALKNPDFAPFTQEFNQRASRVISCKRKEKRIGSNTISRDNSFSESRSNSISSEYTNLSLIDDNNNRPESTPAS